MDYTDAALSYALLLFPMGIAGIMMAQGIAKLQNKDPSGKVVAIMGGLLLVLIPVVYYLLTTV